MLPTHFRHWLYILLFVIAGLTLFLEKPSVAAPHKTVPKFTPQPTHTPTPIPMATAIPSIAEQLSVDQSNIQDKVEGVHSSELTLWASTMPHGVHQGEIVELHFEVINGSDKSATEVILSDALPFGLALVETETDGIFKEEKGTGGETIVQIFWPNILPDERVSANIRLRVADDLSDGAVLENLAALYVEGLPVQTIGVQIGLPPSSLPHFD